MTDHEKLVDMYAFGFQREILSTAERGEKKNEIKKSNRQNIKEERILVKV